MNYLAIDLGAESGRVILGSLDQGRISLEELHRFPNTPIRTPESVKWNFESIRQGVYEGLSKAKGRPLASISADSWGVDYILDFDTANAYHYRDPRTARSSREFLEKVPWPTIFEETGIQYMPINTLFQLASEPPKRLRDAECILSIADFVNYILGEKKNAKDACIEESMASTFQLYNPRTRDWSALLLERLGLKRAALGDVVPSGTVIGQLNGISTKHLFRGQAVRIIATCSHDTGAAVAAVPAEPNTNWAYLSSGTWSLMGVERAEPIINDLARELNFTNEIGYGRSIRLLKNISGLWLLQECRRAWHDAIDYATATKLAEPEEPFRSLINPLDERFLAPSNMPEAVASFCRETNQPEPKSPGQFTRCILESLSLLYRKTLLQLEQLTGDKLEILHIVGGGSKNALLNQFAANACQIPVLAGPVEATALGNILIQAITLGEVPDLNAARALIRKNFALARFDPMEGGAWPKAFASFEAIQKNS